MPSRITEDDFEKALDYLRDSAPAIGAARKRLVLAERMVGHVEALLMRGSNASSADARKAEARSSERYIEAVTEEAEAAGEFEKLRAFREAAAAKIDAWRTEQATYRGMKA